MTSIRGGDSAPNGALHTVSCKLSTTKMNPVCGGDFAPNGALHTVSCLLLTHQEDSRTDPKTKYHDKELETEPGYDLCTLQISLACNTTRSLKVGPLGEPTAGPRRAPLAPFSGAVLPPFLGPVEPIIGRTFAAIFWAPWIHFWRQFCRHFWRQNCRHFSGLLLWPL